MINEEELIRLKHELSMRELEYARKSLSIKHEQELERQRIKSAEIKRNLIRKSELLGRKDRYV